MDKTWIAALLALLTIAASVVSVVRAHDDHDGHDHSGHSHSHDEDDESEESATEVLVLTASNFDETIAAHDMILVEFYAPWCGHCKALAPEYDRASIELSGAAVLGKVDCTEHRDICERYGVQGFPTVKLFRNDGADPADYDQARTAPAIVKFMKKQKQPAYTVLASAAEITAAAAKDGINVIGYIAAADQPSTDVFVGVARALRNDYEFYLVTDDKLGAASAAPRVVLNRKFDDPTVTFTGEFTAEEITAFVRTNAFPSVGEIGPDNYQKYVERGLPLAWIFINKETDQAVLSAAREVASSFRSSLSIVWLDGVKWADHAKTFGLSGVTPGIVVEDREHKKNYVLPQATVGADGSSTPIAVTAASLRAHFAGFVDGTLQPTMKSEAIPEQNDGPVKIVVGKSFQDIVMDDSKDVFVEFYAPWCGHCKSLAPKYEKLGEMFADTPSVVIAKVDATENDTPADIQGFPTILLYPAGAKQKPTKYTGDRTEAAMAKWIRDNATTLKKAKKPKAAAGSGATGDKHDEL
jgi:protein disulfide-isomerase A1